MRQPRKLTHSTRSAVPSCVVRRNASRLSPAAIFSVVLALLAVLCAAPRVALAAPPTEDAAVNAEVQKILGSDVAEANYGAAKRRLGALLERCRKKAGNCTAKTVAAVNVQLGLVAFKMTQNDAASAAFAAAITADPTVELPVKSEEPARKLFIEQKAEYDAKHPQNDDPYHVAWEKKDAAFLFVDAMAAKKAQDYPKCMEKIRAAIAIEDNAGARLHLSDCLDGQNRLVDALREVVAANDQKGGDALSGVIREKSEAIMKRLGRVKIEVPERYGELRVTLDDRSVPRSKWATASVVDPGEHHLVAEGVVAGTIMSDDQTVKVEEGQTVVVKVVPVPRAVAPGQLDCIRSATTEAQLQQCVAKEPSTISVHAQAEMSGYTDTQRVQVLSPSIAADISAPTHEWNVGGSYVLDVLSAASADVVSTASPRFYDTRHAGALHGMYAYAPWTFTLNGGLSSEHDYLSRGVHGAVSLDLFEKQFTPKIGYGIALDTIGRTGVPFDVYSNSMTTHDIEISATLILTPKSLAVFGAALQFELGDQSKPYRYIPMFAPGSDVPNHASVNYVNAIRLPERPLEQLPLERDRYALLGRYILRVRDNATLRIDERLYSDNWGVLGSTTEGRYVLDVSQKLRAWGGLRLHVQGGASFYKRGYFAQAGEQGVVKLPIVRTTDRELGSLLSPSPILGGRYMLTSPDAKYEIGVTAQLTLLYTRYFDALYTGSRTAIFGTTAIDFVWQ